jgi:hypothetical protein
MKTLKQRQMEEEDMRRAISNYRGPVTVCPPAKASAHVNRGWKMPETSQLQKMDQKATLKWSSLSDTQLRTVMTVAGTLDQDKRSTFLERIAAQLQQRGRFNDDDVAQLALTGLVQHPAA